jgi:hypothetical protein
LASCRKAITTAYRYVPWSGPTAGWYKMMLCALLVHPRSEAPAGPGGESWPRSLGLAIPILCIGVVVTADRKDMTADWVPSQISLDPQSGRMLDTARGILIGLRRCRSEAAFQELLVAAQRHRVPVFAMAWALVQLSCGGDKSPETFTAAQAAARHEWGRLFAEPVALP